MEYRDEGKLSARIIIIGEALGEQEDRYGLPFQGPSGWRLNEWLSQAGLTRRDCFITNVVCRRPIANKIDTVPEGELAEWIQKLHHRLGTLTDPVVVVPMGNVALRAITNRQRDTITQARGFIQTYIDANSRTIKVVPTIHPAATFRTPYWQRRCQLDFRRIAAEATTHDVNLSQRSHITAPTLGDLYALVDDVQRHRDIPLSIDIETWGRRITCVGFAQSANLSVTVPTDLRYWGDAKTLAEAWQIIEALCLTDAPKVLQNGNYDCYWLKRDRNIDVRNYKYDCMGLHHALDAAEDHNLAYMASIMLRMEPWKHIPKDVEAGESREIAAKLGGGTKDPRLVYNGIDCCVQWELADILEPRVKAAGLWDLYETHYVQMFKPLLALMLHGIKVDDVKRQQRDVELEAELKATQVKLLEATNGYELRGNATKKAIAAGVFRDLSSKKVQKWLYDVMRVPKHVKRSTGATTADEVAIRKIMLKNKPVAPACELILSHRRTKKLREFLDVGALDSDGRLRSSYGFSPETGRLSSSKNPMWTGRNGQNVDREVRGIYVPDDDCIFLELDLSQAEDRIVKVLASQVPGISAQRVEELLWRARAMPWENDEHKRAASAIFGVPIDNVKKDQRFIGKRSRHAFNYSMGNNTCSEQFLKEGFVYTPEECGKFLDGVDRDVPEVRMWQKEVRIEVLKKKRLVNDWERVLDFSWDRLDDDTFRRAYAFLPQSSVPSLLNQFGMIPLRKAIKANGWRANINVNGHDSLLISVHREDAWKVYDFTKRSLERPRWYGAQRVELTVWVEAKAGMNWAFDGGVEWKRPPSQDEFDAAVAKL